jgi:hypothetical protein
MAATDGQPVVESTPTLIRGEASLRFKLPAPQLVTLTVFDVQGRRVDRPLDRLLLDAGSHDVAFRTNGWRAGVYLYRLEGSGQAITGRMVVVP